MPTPKPANSFQLRILPALSLLLLAVGLLLSGNPALALVATALRWSGLALAIPFLLARRSLLAHVERLREI